MEHFYNKNPSDSVMGMDQGSSADHMGKKTTGLWLCSKIMLEIH